MCRRERATPTDYCYRQQLTMNDCYTKMYVVGVYRERTENYNK